MKKLLIVVGLSVVSQFAFANSDTEKPEFSRGLAKSVNQDSGVVKDVNEVDLTKFCVYKNELYSEGSDIKVSDTTKVCTKKYESVSTSPLIWKNEP